MYRKDIFEAMRYIMGTNDSIKPNFAAVARKMGCDYRTAKAAYERLSSGEKQHVPRKKKPSKLDGFKETVDQKLEADCKVSAIYHFIKGKGYEGGYTTLGNYCRSVREAKARVAKMRFETEPGRQGQIDWKETMVLTSRSGIRTEFNVFLMVLGYSRAKFIELTTDRNQNTLMKCIADALSYFGGGPREILFDNMKTVAGRARSSFGEGAINAEFLEFSKDALFQPRLCMSYHPETKGKAEDLAKIMERLRAYDGEFDTIEELSSIVDRMRDSLNGETSQATGRKPNELLEKEKEHLTRPDTESLLKTYVSKPVLRKVSAESTVSYCRSRYSVSPRLIGRTVTIEPRNGKLYIYDSKELVAAHAISRKTYNFAKDHYVEIMKAGAYRNLPDEVIEKVATRNLAIYDSLG